MSPEAALRTDHVNLLIHRYLQESGFENAAKALHVDWQRQPEHRDPESLPFAHTLQRNELISVIQAGLHYDDLKARARKTDRQFQWTSSRERTEGYVENGAGSRPSSSGRRKGQAPAVRASDDFPTPMPKRQRRSEGSDTHVNGERSVGEGDAVDADGDAEADAEGEDDPDVTSPAVLSEPEAVPTERYDSVMTQTDFKAVPKTSTLSWTIEKPGAKLLEGSWNLGPEKRHAHTLLAVGDSLCRLYEIPDSMDDPVQIKSLDEPILTDSSAVTAVAWRPDGEAASFALDLSSDSAEDPQPSSLSIVERSRDGSSAVFLVAPPKLEPAGIILSLRYSPGGEYLLAAKTNTRRGLVQVWKTALPEGSEIQMVHEPIAWRMFENPIHDVLWSNDDSFAVSGEAGLSCLYQIDGSLELANEAQTTGNIEMRGLISLNSSITQADHAWDHVRIDQNHKVSAFASNEAKTIVLTSRIHSPDPSPETDCKIDLAGNIVALDFQPAQNGESAEGGTQTPSLLAVALEEGPCCIYIASRQTDGTNTCTEGPTLSLAGGPIITLAWSTKGDYLAIGNADLVQIWHTNSFKRVGDGAANPGPDAYVTWRPASEISRHENEQNDEESEVFQPSLSWSSDDSLAYAADKQIAILRFKTQQPETNGQSSPQR